ncbi:hypothetical protein ASPWEDRAFT_104581 [Aspergillus wentii DTO 134E9]|uniref:Major facilitator superfamily (MFS) profile domain-containing protein n=1 Tax=Aspergillus wentii DTO 134E9 TaxID=1073089 RepID=A0A1L9RT89_ASPWE|nr:uncharacterized protein ASPWEDRAFT_104581 [Aspergillus wentii DTO 134E9]OJJ38114.1 hypothetical protein ASPWEDRAFT_104581 [Aspergillus wentii DTO 134E9]
MQEIPIETFNADEEKRLIRRIDWHLMPLLTITYGLQFMDKMCLAWSAILGMKEDLNLVGQEYSWSSSIFYVGFLAASYPISLGFVKFPLGRYLSLLVLAWGIILTLHALTPNYPSLMILRTLLGVFESAITPGFSLITGMWYTPTEHVSRHTIWFAGNASSSIIGSLITYAIMHYTGSFPKWKLMFLIFGLVTVVWAGVLWFFLPDGPMEARFLSRTEREYVALRPKMFQRTTQTKTWEGRQVVEAVGDVKVWWFCVFVFVICVPNGGIGAFSTLIINSMGYDKYQTILMAIPGQAFILTMLLVSTLLTSTIRKARLVCIILCFVLALTGILMIKLVPETQKLTRLAGFWLVQCLAPSMPLLLALVAGNIAGFTKKSTTMAMVFVAYCVGNIVGPQFFKESEAPSYHTAYTTIMICFAVTIAMAAIFRVYLQWENHRRDKTQGVSIDPEASRAVRLGVDDRILAVDETDGRNKSFRYVV